MTITTEHHHLSIAHLFWREFLAPGATVIDATCGNGRDSLVLAELLEAVGGGDLHLFDIQQTAIDASRHRLSSGCKASNVALSFYCECHSGLERHFAPSSAQLIVYNLGYLPGGDKSVTTRADRTLDSLNAACQVLALEGIISIMVYPGHLEGQREDAAIQEWIAGLDPQLWVVSNHRFLLRNRPPHLYVISRRG